MLRAGRTTPAFAGSRFRPFTPKNKIRFAFAGGTNLDPAKDMHMHESTLTFVDDDHIEVAGVAWVDGKPSESHCVQLKLVRKK